MYMDGWVGGGMGGRDVPPLCVYLCVSPDRDEHASRHLHRGQGAQPGHGHRPRRHRPRSSQ